MRTLVHSSRLQFTRDGRTLIAADPDAVTFVELRGDERRRIPIPGVQAIAAFADQVWVATRRGALIRLAGDGRRLDEHPLPACPDGVLIPATIGPPAALWSARESVMLADDLGSLAIVPAHVDAAIPIAGRRFAHHAGLRLTLPAGPPVMLEGGHRIAGGGLVLEGTSLALITEHTGGRAAVVLALASRGPAARVRRDGDVRVRARLRVVAARARCDDDVRRPGWRELRAWRSDDRGSSGGAPGGEDAEANVDALPPVIVDALERRPRRARLPRAEALAELDREIRSVMLWSLCAISSAWDTRRAMRSTSALAVATPSAGPVTPASGSVR